MGRTSVVPLSALSVLLMLIPAQAPDINHDPNSCDLDKEYTQCGCTVSCDNLRPRCTNDTCEPRCFCKNGTVEDYFGNCVKKEECCSGNTTYSDCGNDCGRVCPSRFHILIVCRKEINFPGCFCNPGYLHLGSNCVLPEDCPKIDKNH